MTVNELIAELQKHDGKLQVECYDRFGEYATQIRLVNNVASGSNSERSLDIIGEN